MKRSISLAGALFFLLVLTQLISCKKDEEDPDVIASFTFQVDAADFMKVAFTNQSTNFSALSWNFGDNSATSAETNPVHTFADLGDFVVTLTATSLNGKVTDVHTATVSITDPNAELTKLVGEGNDGKIWKLIRTGATGRYPIQVFQYNIADPANPVTSWWAMGLGNNDLANRPCMLNDEWIFSREGLKLEYKSNGDYWAEGGVFKPDNICALSTDPMIAQDDADLSAWGDGTHTFELNGDKLKAIGNGAFIGFIKLAIDYEVYDIAGWVSDEVIYDVVKLTDDATDTLIIQGHYYDNPQTTTEYQGTWRFVLVHYDNPDDEPPIPTNNPAPGFSFTNAGLVVTFTNTSQYCDSYSWDFGDGATSTDENPVHTYATDGFYNVVLSGTNENGTSTFVDALFLSVNSPALTEDLLQGAAWRDVVGEKTIFVGGGMGLNNWWAVPKSELTGTGAWSCMTDDEFTFQAGGVFTYDGKGVVRNDGYLAAGSGCVEEASLTGNGLYFASGAHTYTFTPANGTNRAIIELTNGTDRAAFIGFYKGYYGGENGAAPGAEQPLPNGGLTTNRYEVMGYINNGTKEYLFVTVDITGDHSGTASWSAILER